MPGKKSAIIETEAPPGSQVGGTTCGTLAAYHEYNVIESGGCPLSTKFDSTLQEQ